MRHEYRKSLIWCEFLCMSACGFIDDLTAVQIVAHSHIHYYTVQSNQNAFIIGVESCGQYTSFFFFNSISFQEYEVSMVNKCLTVTSNHWEHQSINQLRKKREKKNVLFSGSIALEIGLLWLLFLHSSIRLFEQQKMHPTDIVWSNFQTTVFSPLSLSMPFVCMNASLHSFGWVFPWKCTQPIRNMHWIHPFHNYQTNKWIWVCLIVPNMRCC